MTRPLYVNELFIENFGGLANRRIDLGGPGLVVVFGGNEAGKSTAATALSWLLVGPHGSTEEAHRFGQPREKLRSRFDGSFDGEQLRIEGSFEILLNGPPNARNTRAQYKGTEFPVKEWTGLLGGIDSSVFNAVYRMWGGDLHDSYGIIDEVAQIALAGLGGNVRVSDVLSRLEDKRKELVTSDRAGFNSWNSLQKSATSIEADIRKSGTNAEEYSNLCRRAEEIKENLQSRRREWESQSRRLVSVRTLDAVSTERAREKDISSELNGLDEVPVEWQTIVNDVVGLESVVEELESKEFALKTIHDDVKSLCVALGLDEVEAQQISISAGQPVTVTRLHGRLIGARQAAAESRADLSQVAESVRQAQQARERAEEDLREVGVSVDDLVIPTESESQRLLALIDDWRKTQTEVVSAERYVAIQTGKVREAEYSLESAQEHWKQLGVEQSAQEWRVAPKHQTADSRGSAIGGRLVLPGVLAALIATASVVLFPRFVAGIITAATVASLSVVWMRLQPTEGKGEEAVIGPESEAVLVEAANRVVGAMDVVRTQKAELVRLEAERDAKVSAVEFPKGRVREEMSRLGLGREGTSEENQAILERIVTLREAENKSSEEKMKFTRAQIESSEAEEREESLVSEMNGLIQSLGVPASLSVDEVAENIEEFFQLASRIREADRVEGERSRLDQNLQGFIGALQPKDKERARSSLLVEARRLAELHEKRRGLEQERSRLNEIISSRFRDDKDAKLMSSELLTREQILDEIEHLEEAIRSNSDSIEQLNQDLGETQSRIGVLEDEDRLSALKLAMGQRLDQADDQLMSGVVQAVAYSLLKQHADERRRNNQPSLVGHANQLLSQVADAWEKILIDTNDSGSIAVSVSKEDGRELSSSKLSTGARALTHLAIRLAMVRADRDRRQVCFPVICDDPLVHFDDERAQSVMPLLAEIAADGHQVILFTCHGRTVDAGRAAGARIVQLG